MQTSLALTALLMGLVGGPHCAAMCGAACAALGRGRLAQARGADGAGRTIPIAAGGGKPSALPQAVSGAGVSPGQALFQLGRLLSYSALGAVAAASMQAVGWLSVHAAALRPVWSLLHVAAIMLGLFLVWQARQPVWLEEGARQLWRRIRSALPGTTFRGALLVMGLAWGFLPCGLLYSALLVAALSPGVWQGAGVMALFALGSSVSLWAAPSLWLRLKGRGDGGWAIRLAGAALVLTSGWALWHGLMHNAAPWCVTPSVAS